MKVLRIILFFLTLSVSPLIHAESEEGIEPTLGVSIKHKLTYALIEGYMFYNVNAKIIAADGYWLTGVKIIIRDNMTGKTIYRKRLPNAYLYTFPDGAAIIGRGNALKQIMLFPSGEDKGWCLIMKKQGI